MSMVNEATFAISSIFRVVTRTAKAFENIAEAGEKYTHVAVNHADLCDLESQKKKEIRLNKMDAKVAASMKREEEAWLD